MSQPANWWTSVLRWLAPPNDEEAASPVAQNHVDRAKAKSINKPAGPSKKYLEIQAAVEDRLNYLLHHEIPEHRKVAGQDVMELNYIEIESSPEGEALLKEFFEEFNPAARQSWVRKLLGANGLVKLDVFDGVHASFNLPATENLDKHEQMLSQGKPLTYSVHVWGSWVQQAVPPSFSPDSRTIKGHETVFRILDTKGSRQERRGDYPLTVGRNDGCGVAVAGTFVSGVHFVLHFDGGRLWLEDLSRNGTWIEGRKAPPKQRVELDRSIYRLKLGRETGEARDCPEIELEIARAPAAGFDGATPIASFNATPISMPMSVAAPAGGLLAVLSIEDATGNPRRDITQLPFTIGRGQDRDYTTSPAHAGVSGRHLVIEDIDDRGAQVWNEAHHKNGTALGETLQPERFFWPFDAEIVLAPKWRKDPPVRIVLKRPH
jgi:hypothetical protein